MRKEEFYVTDEDGRRHYGAEIEKLRRSNPIRLAVALLALAILIFANIHRAAWLGDNVLAYVAVYGGAAYASWRLVHAHAAVREFDRQWSYYERDLRLADHASTSEEAPAAQQPHGHNAEEGTI